MIRSIFSKILFSHIAVILVTTLTMGILMSYLIRNHVVENRRNELIQKGLGVVSLINPDLQTGRLSTSLEGVSELVGANAWIMDNTGRPLAGKASEWWMRRAAERPDELRSVFSGNVQSWVWTGRKQGDPSVVVAVPILNTSPPAALFLSTPITGVNQAAAAVEKLLFVALAAGMGTALAIGFFISRGLTRPIENIISSADSFAKGNFGTRAQVSGSDEVSRLGKTFNSMAEAIEGVEQNRRDFLANVSHELKTPVASIQALAESLVDGIVRDPDQQKRYLTNIVNETGRIDRLIRDLLDMSQLDAGELPIRVLSFDLTEFVKNHTDTLLHLLRERNLQMIIDSPPNLKHVIADPDRLGQVLTNLLSNAIRHSPTDSFIQIAISSADSTISLSVTDRGPGIPSSDLPYIFDRFYRVEKSRVRSDGGTGLGLAISKKFIAAMNGTICVKSVEGHGATFTVTLPTA